ncbi:MAG TPA: DUF3090 family protein [Candidatus Sulfotelmatobacter sp.]|nr:DUF3090 family protein [Candidatus Sulfotelmatobacter sp.]
MAIYELDPVDRIGIAALGEPGQRRFFLLATGSGRTLTLACEKSQVQALLLRLKQMLEAQKIEQPEPAGDPPSMQPGEPEWQIGEMGLGYHEARHMFVLVASQAAVGEAREPGEQQELAPAEDAPSVRFWLSPKQVVAFSKQAESVLTAGRPLCPRCGLPMDPAGHPCPVMNGARPIF